MAQAKFQKGSDEWLMFTEFWQLCQNYWNIEDNDKYWWEMSKEADKFFAKYKHIPLAKEIALAFLKAQETKYKYKE